MTTDRDVDVVVVGSGAAGLSAALSARERGARSVVVAESEGVVGGSSRLSGGLMMGAGTRYQQAVGIEDDPDSLYHDYMQLNQWKVESAVVRRLAELSGPSVEWLGDLGVQFYDQLVFGGDERLPRVHCPIGRGQAVIDVLTHHCRERGVEIALGRRIDRLLAEKDAVVGVAVGDDTITAGAVVVAAGGFGNNPDKLARFFPAAADTEWAWYIGAEGSRGDHLDLATQVGAQLTGFNRGLRLLHANFAKIYEAYLPGWLTLVSRAGRRFCDETAPYGIMDGLIQDQGDVAFAIFDQLALDEATAAGVARYKQKVPGSTKKQSPHWNSDIVDAMVKEGKVHRAETIRELAAALGLPEDHLVGTVDRLNRSVDAGEDVDYLKDAKFLQRISRPPFYGAEIRPATVCFTSFGMRIDRNGQVLSDAGPPIPGLFAAGESVGGVVGPRYVGSGNSYANCVTFGRVAGASAAVAAGAATGATAVTAQEGHG
jgi:fumarate reductase flavoprotein subunit